MMLSKNLVITSIMIALMFTVAANARIGSSQTGSGSPPPTYDWNENVPGTQGPTSPLLAGADVRFLRTFQVGVPVLVPLAELQAALPPGFIATANPAGSNTAQVTLNFIFQSRNTRVADGQMSGPGSGMTIQTSVTNTNLMPNRQETGILGQEFSSQEIVDSQNAVYGPGSARLARVNVQIGEDGGNLNFKFVVTDTDLGLNVTAQATCPGPIATRSKNDPNATPLRFLIPLRSFRLANQSDQFVVPQAMANAKVDTPGGKLQVPVAGGSRILTISGIGANITFQRNNEFFNKLE